MARTRERRRRSPAHAAHVPKQPRSYYLITGLAVGALWLLNRDKSLVYHAVQMTAVMSALTVVRSCWGRSCSAVTAAEHPPQPAPTPFS
jgi:hypothetical protein